MESSLVLCYMTGCHGSLSGMLWPCAPGQEPGQELVQTPAVLNYKIYRDSELATTLHQFFCLVAPSTDPQPRGVLRAKMDRVQ